MEDDQACRKGSQKTQFYNRTCHGLFLQSNSQQQNIQIIKFWYIYANNQNYSDKIKNFKEKSLSLNRFHNKSWQNIKLFKVQDIILRQIISEKMSILPKFNKPPKLKPLVLGDVIVAFINQENTEDRTEIYKRMLGNRWKNVNNTNQQNEEQELKLPQFACKQYTQQQIMDFHIKNKTRDTSQFQLLLNEVDKRIKIAMEDYGDKLTEGEKGIQDLISSLAIACQKVEAQRNYIKTCVDRVKKSYSKVGPKLRKINNISKVIEIMSIWGQSKIPFLFSIDLNHPHLYEIKDALQLFGSAQRKIQQNPLLSQSESLKKIHLSLKQKQKKFIQNIFTQFTDSIIRFTTTQQYRTKYDQYIICRDKGLCKDVLSSEGIKQMLEQNAKSMFYSVLVKLTPNMNVDLLNQTIYLDFYDQVIEQFVIYFRSWHYVTTFHLDNQTPYGQLFLESRKLVFITLSNRIGQSIENSKKFISLQYKVKLQLVEKLQDYIQAGQKWMGHYQGLGLAKSVTSKLSTELQNLFSLYNNLIKNILIQQISVSALQKVGQVRPYRQIKVITQVTEINYEKVSKFVGSISNNSRNVVHMNGSQKTSQPLVQPPQVRLQIGSTFSQMISEYIQRSRFLQSNKSIYLVKIYQHFQLIIFMLYQVCIRDQIKQKLKTSIKQKLQQYEGSTLIKLQEMEYKKLNQYTKIYIFKRKYSQIIQFVAMCGNKFDGIKVPGIIDINKVFQSNSVEVINGYTKLLVRIFADIKNITRWLNALLPHTALKNYKQASKIGKLGQVATQLFGLVLENNMQNLYKKYIDTLSPIMLKLKWQIKKFNQEVALQYKQYKMKILQTFRNNTLIFLVKSEAPEFSELIMDKEVEVLYRALLQCYGKIDKINDNGRQIIRLDCIQVTKILSQIGVGCGSWSSWFDKYLDFTSQRSYKSVLQKLTKIGALYEPFCWKYPLMWIIADLSARQKKQYYAGITKIYLQYLSQAK